LTHPVRLWRSENWADFLPSTLGYSSPPVDLYAVARHRRIKRLSLRFMIPRGVLMPVDGGFEVYLRDSCQKEMDISEPEAEGGLSNRQRFSLAHEIAHTFFYKFSNLKPAPEAVSNELELEKTCDRTAAHILIPTNLLKREIGDYQRIDASLIRSIACKFRTSLTVAIDRLTTVEPSSPIERCVLLVRRIHGDGQIRALYFGVGMLRTLPQPRRYGRLTEWLSDFPRRLIDRGGDLEWRTSRMGRSLTFERTELESGTDFLLQVQVSSSDASTAAA
jgi:IrrE N-terminal-like domain